MTMITESQLLSLHDRIHSAESIKHSYSDDSHGNQTILVVLNQGQRLGPAEFAPGLIMELNGGTDAMLNMHLSIRIGASPDKLTSVYSSRIHAGCRIDRLDELAHRLWRECRSEQTSRDLDLRELHTADALALLDSLTE